MTHIQLLRLSNSILKFQVDIHVNGILILHKTTFKKAIRIELVKQVIVTNLQDKSVVFRKIEMIIN